MIVQEPIPHWNNFTVQELKQILEHCRALERLGIAQDAQMIASIERDIALRTKKTSAHHAPFEVNQVKMEQRAEKQNRIKVNKGQPTEYLLAQNV